MITDQKQYKQTYKKELITKILEIYPWTTLQAAKERAERLLNGIPEPLRQNLYEWLDNKPLTDIWIGEYCVKQVMEIRHDKHPLEALEALTIYSNDKKSGTREIWEKKK